MGYNEFYFHSEDAQRFIHLIRVSNINYEQNVSVFNAVAHSHDFSELLFVKKGKGKLFVNGTLFSITQGDAFIIPPQTEHYEITLSKENLTLYFIAFTSSLISHNDLMIFNGQNSEILQEFRPLFDLMTSNNQYSINLCYNLAENIVLYLLSQKLLISKKTEIEQKSIFVDVKDLKHYIDEYFPQKISISILAKRACLSEAHFIRTFKNYTGKTPLQYILDKRLNAAKESLTYTDKSITSICYETGFSDLSNFIRKFKIKYGCTPQKFRQLLLSDNN